MRLCGLLIFLCRERPDGVTLIRSRQHGQCGPASASSGVNLRRSAAIEFSVLWRPGQMRGGCGREDYSGAGHRTEDVLETLPDRVTTTFRR